MEKQTIETPEIEILTYLNDISGRRFRATKENLKGISARFKDGFTADEMKEVIQIKTLEWKNNPTMSVHLNPVTLFRPSNFEKYINQVISVKENPALYKEHYEQLNNARKPSTDNTSAFNKINAMFGKGSSGK